MKSVTSPVTLFLLAALTVPASASDPCETTAKLQRSSAKFEQLEELNVNFAACLNYTDPAEQAECIVETFIDYAEGRELANEQYEARLDLCDLLGGGAYDPDKAYKVGPAP